MVPSDTDIQKSILVDEKQKEKMEQETLYTAAKWDVLKALGESEKSPIALAKEANTSVSNISQSLRFLELAGIVKRERIGNRDKGQPRVMYSLAGNKAYMIVTARNFVDKKQIFLDDYKKMLLRIWFFENESLHVFIERAIQNIESEMNEINGIFLDTKSVQEIRFSILLKDTSKLKKDSAVFKDANISWMGASRKVKYSIVTESEILTNGEKYYPIHDPQQIIGGEAKQNE